MKKKFFKRLALALALTVAVNTVDVPVAAAARPGFVSSKAVVKVGQTKNYRTKNNSGHSARFVIGNQKVASVKYSKGQKYAKVTGVKPGKTTLRADFKSYATKKVTQVRIPVYVESPNPGFMSTKAVVKPGQTKKYRTQNHFGYSTRFVIGNKKVASVKYSKSGKFAKVTGVKPGQTTLRVDFKNYLTKKVTPVRMPVYVKAAGTAAVESITVSTQAQLEKALKSGKYGKIVIETDAAIELTVPAGDYKKVDLVVDAPKAKFTNKGQFHEITIKGTAANYTENGKDNVIYVMADEADFKVADNTKVEKVIFKGKKTNVQMGVGSRMRSVVNETGENILVRTPDRVEMLPAGTADKTIEAGTGTSSSSSSSGSTSGGSGSGSGNVGAVTGIEKDGADNYLGAVEDKIQLSVKLVPANATAKVVWESDIEGVATVDENGKVTIKGPGKAVITAKVMDKNGKFYTVTYEVFGKQENENSAITATESEREVTLENGKSEILRVTNPANEKITWFSDKEDVATVDADGKVTAKGEGTAHITGITENGDYVEYTVEVTKTKPHLEKDGAAAPAGGSDKATYYTVKDEDDNAVTVTGSSISVTAKDKDGKDVNIENQDYSKFINDNCSGENGNDNSLVLPVGWTDVNVTIITKDDESYSVHIPEVTKQEKIDIAVKIVGNGNIFAKQEEGSTSNVSNVSNLTANVSNLTGTEKIASKDITYQWRSDNKDVATVDENGKVTGIVAGTANITVTVKGNDPEKIGEATDTFAVTVTDHYEVRYAVTDPRTGIYTVGDEIQIGAVVVKNGERLDDVTYAWNHLYNSTTYTVDFIKSSLEDEYDQLVNVRVLESPISYVRLTVTGKEIDLGNGKHSIDQRVVLTPKPIQNPAPIRITNIAPTAIRNMPQGFKTNQELMYLEQTALEDGWKSDTVKDGVITVKVMYNASEGNKIVSYQPYQNMESKKYFALDVITLGQVTGKIEFRNKANPVWMSVEKAKETHLLDAFGGQDDFVYWCGVVPNANDWFEIKFGDYNPLHVNMIPWQVTGK